MKKNDIDIRITGLDFRQDVEPLIKEFFPGFRYTNDVEIDIRTGETFLEIRVDGQDPVREEINSAPLPDGDLTSDLPAQQSDCDRTSGGQEPQSDGDRKIWHRNYRNQLLRALYRELSRYTGRTLPWGILTGVRPTKLLFERIARGEAQPLQYMAENYYVSPEKASLAARIAATEYRLLNELDYRHGYSLYVGIPFCPSICNYCTFGSHPIGTFRDYVKPYIEALSKEIRVCSDFFARKYPGLELQTVYFGGGTPTSLSTEDLRTVIRNVKDSFPVENAKEFTVEAGRPDSITRDKLEMLREEGIGRISINPQTFVDKTLEIIGRNHTATQVEEAFRLAREIGFDNINMDLIAGLTGEDEKDFEYTLGRIGSLMPDCITVHTLALKRASRLVTNPELYASSRGENEEDSVGAMLRMTGSFMKENGYEPYYMYRQKNMTGNLENVGYSKPGKEGLYNILIMEEVQPILALGAGASSKFIRKTDGRFGRVENVKNVREYIERIDEMTDRKLFSLW